MKLCSWVRLMLQGGAALLLLIPGIFTADSATASDWPFFRGPDCTGVSDETRLTNDWQKSPPAVVWTRDLGQGYSACTVAKGRVFTQYQDAIGQYLVCFRLTDGEVSWRERYASSYDALSIYPGPRSSPTVADGFVFYTTPIGDVACVRADSGKQVWRSALQKTLHGRGTEFGYSASPLVWKGMVLLPVGGRGAAVAALNARTGTIVWQTGDDEASYCSLFPIELEGHPLLVAYLQNAILILDGNDGKILWRQELSTGYDEHSAWPLYAEPLLVFSAPFQAGAQAQRLSWESGVKGTRRLSVRQAWHSPRLSNDVDSSLVVGGFLYGFDLRDAQSKAHRPSRGEFRCLDMQTGEVRWSSKEPGQCTSVAADGKLWMFNDRGN